MPAFQIDLCNSTKKYSLSLPKWKKNTEKILKALGWKKAGISISFVGDRKSRVVNKEYLNHDWPTDVIAFSQLEGPRPKEVKDQSVYLGDLVISLDVTARQSKEYGNSFDYELAFYICHGTLHLMGYDDKTPKEAARMEQKQKLILKKCGIK